MDFCETRPERLVSSVQLTPSLEAVFSTLPSATADLNVYSIVTARKQILSGVQLEIAALPHVRIMASQDLHDFTKPISQYYTRISPSTSGAIADYMPWRTAFSFACLFITNSFVSFSISATRFRRQWQCFFKHPQRFFRGTQGRFLHIVPNLEDDDTEQATAFLYLTDAEFAALRELAKEVLAPNPAPALYPDITHVYTSAT